MSANGVILERLSGKKLSILVSILILFQAAFFLIGALKFPHCTHTETVEGIMCRDKQAYKQWQSEKEESNNDTNLYYLRDYLGRSFSNCEKIQADENRNVILNARPEEIIHAFQIPLPRDDKVLRLHRLFQTMTSLLQLQVLLPPVDSNEKEIVYDELHEKHKIQMDVSLAYHNSIDYDDEWHLMEQKKVAKNFHCVRNQYSIDCDMLELFELGSVHHEFYLVNIKLGDKLFNSIQNSDLMKTTHLPEVRLYLTFIYQTGGFTLMYLIMKSCILPMVLFTLCWYWNRITKLDRNSNVLEKTLFGLGIACCLLNLPVEWLTLYYDMKWMLLYSDLRQGIFYSALSTFWIVFCGEHYIEQSDSKFKTFKSYWIYVGVVWTASLCLLIYELSHRGMQLSSPFFSVWDTQFGTNLAYAMLAIACSSGILYFVLLLVLVCKVFLNFRSKQSHLPALNHLRRAFYEGVIYRFKFLLIVTLFCAAFTMSYFVFNYVYETHIYFDQTALNLNGGYIIGVYGMWNIYVISVMIFYAPSHKNKETCNAKHYEMKENNDTTELVKLQTKLIQTDTIKSTTESVVTQFANKIASA